MQGVQDDESENHLAVPEPRRFRTKIMETESGCLSEQRHRRPGYLEICKRIPRARYRGRKGEGGWDDGWSARGRRSRYTQVVAAKESSPVFTGSLGRTTKTHTHWIVFPTMDSGEYEVCVPVCI